MPVIEKSSYKSPLFFKNGHIQTLYPAFYRKVVKIPYKRERIATPDGDFLDLDWSAVGSKKLLIVLHGLEGHAHRFYVRGIVKIFNDHGWDAVALNFRGCSGEPNRLLRSYTAGDTEDLDFVINNIVLKDLYSSIALVGFSLGANLALKYVGEKGKMLSPALKSAVGISAPCDLLNSCRKLEKGFNRFYNRYFCNTLKEKILSKRGIKGYEFDDIRYIRTLNEFDDKYTGPVHGFKNANDYYSKSSCCSFLDNIQIPSLIINAKDDPLLTVTCYPVDQAIQNDCLFLEMPSSGGHIGFVTLDDPNGYYWHEKRTLLFVNKAFNL